MKTINFLSTERQEFYEAKKKRLIEAKSQRAAIREDAQYIRHYGMAAYLELFPEARSFGISWHKQILAELQFLEQEYLGDLVEGMALAFSGTQDKSANRDLNKYLKKRSW